MDCGDMGGHPLPLLPVDSEIETKILDDFRTSYGGQNLTSIDDGREEIADAFEGRGKRQHAHHDACGVDEDNHIPLKPLRNPLRKTAQTSPPRRYGKDITEPNDCLRVPLQNKAIPESNTKSWPPQPTSDSPSSANANIFESSSGEQKARSSSYNFWDYDGITIQEDDDTHAWTTVPHQSVDEKDGAKWAGSLKNEYAGESASTTRGNACDDTEHRGDPEQVDKHDSYDLVGDDYIPLEHFHRKMVPSNPSHLSITESLPSNSVIDSDGPHTSYKHASKDSPPPTSAYEAPGQVDRIDRNAAWPEYQECTQSISKVQSAESIPSGHSRHVRCASTNPHPLPPIPCPFTQLGESSLPLDPPAIPPTMYLHRVFGPDPSSSAKTDGDNSPVRYNTLLIRPPHSQLIGPHPPPWCAYATLEREHRARRFERMQDNNLTQKFSSDEQKLRADRLKRDEQIKSGAIVTEAQELREATLTVYPEMEFERGGGKERCYCCAVM